jgi:lycopene cyclase-like protein
VPESPDLWIIGAGPAALLLAQACLAHGISIGLIAPDLGEPWPANYGIWIDDAVALGVEAHLHHERRWAASEARFDHGPHSLGRGYALFDDRRLQLDILAQCEAAGARLLRGRVRAIEHDDEGVTLELEPGAEPSGDARVRGRLVVDASGHGSAWIARERGPAAGHQVAWGELRRVETPVELDRVIFMDWSSTGPEERDEDLPPTFLYTLPFAADLVFVEETVLVARLARPPSDAFELLQRRLHRRLDHLGVRCVGAPLEIERCIIPMGGPLPRHDQRTLGFGGAAGMVHPATGFMITTVLRRRERVAAVIAEQLNHWVGPGQPSRAIWRAIWPVEELRAWRLYSFGMEVLMTLDRSGLERFFAGFFELPDPRWRGFVSASSPTPELMATMLRYFAVAPAPIRNRLASALFEAHGRRMARGWFGPSSRD